MYLLTNERLKNIFFGIKLTGLAIVLYLISTHEGGVCYLNERYLGDRWNYRVLKKFKDSKNHEHEALDVTNGVQAGTLYFTLEETGRFYAQVQVGDSISKPTSSLQVTIHRPAPTLSETYSLNFCYGSSN